MTDSPKKYLLLLPPGETYPEQFNSYMFTVMEVIYLAKMLGRVFVLPYICSQPRNNRLAERGPLDYSKFILGVKYRPMESYFDIKKINEYVQTITFANFSRLSRHTLDYVCLFREKPPNRSVLWDVPFAIKKTGHIKDFHNLWKRKERFLGMFGYQRRRYLAKNSPNWPKNLENDYWEIRRSLSYHPKLLRVAQQFINNNLNCKYLAIHWRRGDRANQSAATEIGQMAERTADNKSTMEKWLQDFLIIPSRKLMAKYKLKKVFLATNSGVQWHINYLKTHLPIVMYPASGDWENRDHESITEQIICTKASYFFSSPVRYDWCSSFSRWIIDGRIIDGKGNTVSYQKKMGPGQNNFRENTHHLRQLITDALLSFVRSRK